MLSVLLALGEEQVDYVLVGGVALNLHGLIRATEDVDLFVRAEPDNVARLRRALWTSSDDPALARRIRSLWARAARLAPPAIPRGLRKFRTIEEAAREREQWERARIASLARSRASD